MPKLSNFRCQAQVGEKISQDNMRDDLFDEMAIDALLEAGLTEDEAERQLEDFNRESFNN